MQAAEPVETAPARRQGTISLVVPLYNEAEAIDMFLDRVVPIMEALCLEQGSGCDYELVFVDDGSTDDTLARLIEHSRGNSAIRIVSLSRNFGKDTALTAGLDHATGNAVVPIDADLQDPPEVIPELYEKWLEGYDIIFATRADRTTDSALKRLTAGLFYRIHNSVADTKIPHNTGDFRLMDRRVVDAVRQLPERNRFMKGLFAWVGFRQTGITYRREERSAGRTKWRYWRLWNFAIDGITASSTVPLRIWSYVGGLIAVAAIAYTVILMIRTLLFGADVPGYASIMAAVLFMGGINLLSLGIIGEYLGRTYTEVKNRPLYLVRERIGFLDTAATDGPPWNAMSIPAWPPAKAGTGGSLRAGKSSRA